ncbi:unnamed protein product, partial [Staurois parvus]
MDPFMETNRYNVSTAVWSECHRTVRNRLFLTVLGHSLHTAVETAVWSECHRTVRNSGALQIHLEELCRYTFGINLIFILLLLLLLLLHPHPLLLLL